MGSREPVCFIERGLTQITGGSADHRAHNLVLREQGSPLKMEKLFHLTEPSNRVRMS